MDNTYYIEIEVGFNPLKNCEWYSAYLCTKDGVIIKRFDDCSMETVLNNVLYDCNRMGMDVINIHEPELASYL